MYTYVIQSIFPQSKLYDETRSALKNYFKLRKSENDRNKKRIFLKFPSLYLETILINL
ncbi:hypothetical protein LEP1GSC103_3381 [Leptospira borgpetersenii serovar Javanica str. UI 09931]|uniref:Uncharacterized protein n=1 Tax=Leptospira borgpetersenii serovar Javanica str. UI 09931 TaxID=1049767 RepID=A0AAV3JEI0_LEPBO|nr:hypothetical protein LEP1GSC101_3520 [Leptospira borgpetersenii str. UI 09149]EKQ98683.1 hypothetical protein LEP1GSC121_3004 [Leptospira borgpetersenii serovar Castellonis str. 200801910]EMK08257.1 hypothetical protein LEP1GSC066_0064 [Leptospira sp. serovar Kenya str. Sh9]EMN60209.1 hypothetical protein LEP1GSC090_3494 [Leptospira borgpetersenii serovar Javanica str. MK146]ENO63991.1 hypothetical protein LEP1GSC191_0433 [Leptospira borgpetersenii serovar Mini str. 201000851]EPG59110.1 hyp